jgi:hypothetical protein
MMMMMMMKQSFEKRNRVKNYDETEFWWWNETEWETGDEKRWWWTTMRVRNDDNDDDETRWWSWNDDDEMKRWWWWKRWWWKGGWVFYMFGETMLRETVKLHLGKNTRFLWFRVKSISGYQITRPVCTAPSPIWSPIRPSTTFPLQARVPNHETAGKRTWSWTKHAKPPSARKNVRTYVLARVFDYIARDNLGMEEWGIDLGGWDIFREPQPNIVKKRPHKVYVCLNSWSSSSSLEQAINWRDRKTMKTR